MSAQYQVTGRTAAEISASVERGVRAGDLGPAAALPSVRALAATLGVSPATVAKAYQSLRQRGVLETAGRHGTRVRARPPVADLRTPQPLPLPPGMLDLSAGEPDPRLLPPLATHLRWLADQNLPPVSYATGGPVPALLDAARARLAADGVPVQHDAAVTVTGGALDAIERLLAGHLRPGDAVAVEDPGWANLIDLVAALNLRAVPVAVDDEGPQPSALQAALTAGVRAAVITTRAHNPTGAAVTRNRAHDLRRILGGHPDVLLIEDDHAAELAPVPLHALAGATATWAFVRSAAKPYGPDLRIATLAGDEATIARVAGRMRIGAGWVSTVLQRLLLRLWQDDSVAATVAAARDAYIARRLGLRTALADRGIPARGRTGINVWIPVPDETRAVTALRDAGYAVAAGSRYRIAAPPAIRITVSALPDAAVAPLAAAVARALTPTATPLSR
ncbi:MAG TPA: aminotransferase class I/II-fold pyridoxal phosphate-dependent enzyme [Pilimelia sp.]|nr:aminotransferase class I/II-fold pyridoxal phosphate-dependent enzyme [Pilimelia sp.]